MASQQLSALDNPLSQLVQQIDFAESEFALFFAQLSSAAQRKKWARLLRRFLSSKGIEVIQTAFSEPIQDLLTPIRQNLVDHSPLASACVLVVGLEHSIPPDAPNPALLSHLNLARESYRRYIKHPVVIWLPEYALTRLARNAPDFWAWRSGVFDFDSASHYLERMLAEMDKLEEASKALEALSDILPGDQLVALSSSFREKQQKFLAQLAGSGAIAQGEGAVAADSSSVAVRRDVYSQVLGGPESLDSQEPLAAYCRAVMRRTSRLALTSIDWAVRDPTMQDSVDLVDVYVDLDARILGGVGDEASLRELSEPGKQEEGRQVSVLEATMSNQRLVLLGEPGMGKSTCLNFLAHQLAAQYLGAEELSLEWVERGTVPILVTLRNLARVLAEESVTWGGSRVLWRFIADQLDAQALVQVCEPLRQALAQGKVLVLLDGLDEVPREQLRLVRDIVIAFSSRYQNNRYVVTSRTRSYSPDRPGLPLPWPTFQLAPLDDRKVDEFVARWYSALGSVGMLRPEHASSLTRRLQRDLKHADLKQLASNPLLLTIMVLIHMSRGSLPEARALLFEEAQDILLSRWETAKFSENEDGPALRQLLAQAGRTDVDLKRLLWRLAFEMQTRVGKGQEDGAGDIPEFRLTKSLAELNDNDLAWAERVTDTMKLRSGLLVERAPGVFSFPSRSLREYFAGAHLTAQADFVTRCTRLLRRDWHLWREVILLATERLVFLVGDTSRPLILVGELCPPKMDFDETSWRNTWLAGDILLKAGTKRLENYALGTQVITRVLHRLATLLTKSGLSPRERAHAGDTLGQLGDPRFCLDKWFLSDESSLGFVKIPAGTFLMGSSDEDQHAWDNERPMHEVALPTYWIARYPVTVAQFRAFVEESGHEPTSPNTLNGVKNHPVNSVTWYDALAYCEWLSTRLRTCESIPDWLTSKLEQNWGVMLPSEAEWEKAARGTDGRRYPWGDEFDAARANTQETGIGRATAVGSFPYGASPYGVLDMTGNVWEWTRSAWRRAFQTPDYSYPYDPEDGREDLSGSREVNRVLRGGSYYENHALARPAFRMGVAPSLQKALIGFRVAITSTASFTRDGVNTSG